MTYKTKGTCSSQIDFDLKDGKVYNVRFTGGCNGNLKGIGCFRQFSGSPLIVGTGLRGIRTSRANREQGNAGQSEAG